MNSMKYQFTVPYVKGEGFTIIFIISMKFDYKKHTVLKRNYILMVTHFSFERHQINKIGMITSPKFNFVATLGKANGIRTQMIYCRKTNRLRN